MLSINLFHNSQQICFFNFHYNKIISSIFLVIFPFRTYCINSYYYFLKEKDENIGFLRVQTNEELTEAWLGTAAILPQYQGKGYGSEGLRLLEKEFPTIKQWDLCTVLQDAGMVAFYEKNGYRQTHIEPEKEGMDMVYMKKLIDK